MPNVVDAYDPLRDRYRIAGQWIDASELAHADAYGERRWRRLIIALHLMSAFPWLWARQESTGA